MMDQETLRERKRRKQQQLMIRRYTKLGICAVGIILALVFVIRGVILPITRGGDESVSGSSESFETFNDSEINEGLSNEVSDGGSVAQAPDETASGSPVTTGTVTEARGNQYAAERVPLKGSSDIAKLSDRLPGWHENEEGRWYQNADGTYFAGGFQQIGDQQYSFDQDGYIQTGWVSSGINDYYFNEDGSYNPDKVKPMLALTYDDGPGQYTEKLLDCLMENGAHATFFMVGECVDTYPNIVPKILEAGCELGNHSYDHPDMMSLYNSGDIDGIVAEFRKTDEALIRACGQASTVGRLPYGSGNMTEVFEAVGMPFFMWSLDTEDWRLMDADADYNAVINGDLTDGTIILMHDIHEPSVEASLRIIPELVEKGYKLVTVSEMAEAKGVKLQPASYSDFWQSSLDAGQVKGYTGSTSLSGKVAATEDDSISSGYDDSVTSGDEASSGGDELASGSSEGEEKSSGSTEITSDSSSLEGEELSSESGEESSEEESSEEESSGEESSGDESSDEDSWDEEYYEEESYDENYEEY